MRLLLGVDAGFTKTRAAVCDMKGHVLGQASGAMGSVEGPEGIEGGAREIAATLARALEAAGATQEDVVYAAYGVAGADSPQDISDIRAGFEALDLPGARTGQLTIVNDGLGALRGGAERTWGIVSAAGTGTVVVGRSPDGRVIQVGGIGYLFGDGGGGADLGRAAVRAVFMAEQGALPPTSLKDAVLRLFEVPDLPTLMANPPELWHQRFARLSPAVAEAAARGDLVAQEILLAAGENLGQMAAAAAVQLGVTDTDVEVVLAGGAYRGASPLLRDRATLEIHRRVPRAWVHRAHGEPVAGCLVMAAEALGVDVDRSFQEAVWSALPDGDRVQTAASHPSFL